MERNLGWNELQQVVKAHEELYNYQELEHFCKRYYATATRVVVEPSLEYNDQNEAYYSVGPSEITVWRGDTMLVLPEDEVELLVLLGQSIWLQEQLAKDMPDDPIVWLADVYYDDVYSLELFGVEKGYEIEIDFNEPPPVPMNVYAKEEVCLTF